MKGPLLFAVLCLGVTLSESVTGQGARRPRADSDTVEALPRQGPSPAGCPSLSSLGYQTKSLHDLSVNIGLDPNLLPPDCAVRVFQAGEDTRHWIHAEFNWMASDLFHQPAYWDDPILERYGQSHHWWIQPALSGAHFFGTFPLIPYKIGIDRTHDHIYTLGHYRPGGPTPTLGRRLPLEADAAGFESLSWLAFIFILP